MGQKAAGAGIGIVFGIVLCWTFMISPNVIRETLLLEDPYMFLFFGSAVATGVIGLRVLQSFRQTAVMNGERIAWTRDKPQPCHIQGAFLFGVGWGVANVCPGPILTQVGQGMGWGFVTLAGAVAGVWIFLRQGSKETEPACDELPAEPHRRQSVLAPEV